MTRARHLHARDVPHPGRKPVAELRAALGGAKGAQRGQVKRIGAKDLSEPARPAICFIYEDLAALEDLARPEQVFGMYPVAFIPKILPWLKCARNRVVHVCSGGLPRGEGIRVDIRPDAQPDVLADGRALPFLDASLDALLIDPPYTEHYARDLYGVKYPRPSHLLREAARVVKPCGRIGFVHYITPNPPPGCSVVKVFGLSTGFGFPMRAVTIYEREQRGLL